MPIQVAIVEDDEDIRASLAHRIGESSSLWLLRSYSDTEAAGTHSPRHKPGMVLVQWIRGI